MPSRNRAAVGRGAIPALFCGLVWTLGVEVVPLAHALEHAGPRSDRHCHDGTCHDDGAAGIEAGGHGAHTLAHRDVAALPPLPAIVRWPAVFLADALDEIRIEGAISAPAPLTPHARGPPRA